MVVFAWSIGFFLFFYTIHIVAVRITRPRNQDSLVVRLYIVYPIVLFPLLAVIVSVLTSFLVFHLIAAFFLYLGIAAAFVASFPAIYADCPTLVMAYLIRRGGESGVPVSQLTKILRLRENSEQRVEDAIQDKIIVQDGESIRLTRRGQILFRAFTCYRKLTYAKGDPL